MRPANPRLAMSGASFILLGIVVAWLVEAPALRILCSATPIVIGFGLIRQAYRIE